MASSDKVADWHAVRQCAPRLTGNERVFINEFRISDLVSFAGFVILSFG